MLEPGLGADFLIAVRPTNLPTILSAVPVNAFCAALLRSLSADVCCTWRYLACPLMLHFDAFVAQDFGTKLTGPGANIIEPRGDPIAVLRLHVQGNPLPGRVRLGAHFATKLLVASLLPTLFGPMHFLLAVVKAGNG